MQPGQILVNANGEERKILFVSGDLIIPSKIGNFDMASSNYTKKELEKYIDILAEQIKNPFVEKYLFNPLFQNNIIDYFKLNRYPNETIEIEFVN
jgi:hypothetical protein